MDDCAAITPSANLLHALAARNLLPRIASIDRLIRRLIVAARRQRYGHRMLPDFDLIDQAEKPWRLSEHLDAGAMLVFLRGDW